MSGMLGDYQPRRACNKGLTLLCPPEATSCTRSLTCKKVAVDQEADRAGLHEEFMPRIVGHLTRLVRPNLAPDRGVHLL